MYKHLCLGIACSSLIWTVAQADVAIEPDDPALNQLIESGNYDRELCATAQRIILNAGPDDYVTEMLVASGTTFMNEQMDASHASNTVTVATLIETAKIDRKILPVNAACKLVNQSRAREVLQIDLPSPPGTCRDVNLLTYEVALARLSDSQRQQYLSEGTPLHFEPDYKAAAGGEWIPSVISDFIKPVMDAEQLAYISVQAPSVQVPWPTEGNGDWYQGTHHCKVLTLAAMSRWMTGGALNNATELFPRPRPKCVEPDSRTSQVGSCLLYFGPAGAQFCQDYSGNGWTETKAREDCAIRHPTLTAWQGASDKYTGPGGIFSTASCAKRNVIDEAGKQPVNQPNVDYRGTCVFRCNTPNEALWHQLTPMAGDPDGRMLERRCDAYLQAGW